MKLGIALAGGGARGAAHVGILQALEENGIKGDIYSGTSAGSIVASAKALGYPNRQMIELLKQINGSFLDVNYWGILSGLVFGLDMIESLAKGKNIKKFLDTNFTGTIDQVKCPLGIVSTDILTGAQVIFASHNIPVDEKMDDLISVYTEGMNISQMIYASTAIPIVYPPHYFNRHKLVDGSVVNNMPANIAKAMGADKVIAIDLNSCRQERPVIGILDTIAKSVEIMIDQNEDLSLSYMNDFLVLEPNLTGVSILDFHKADEAYATGYKYGKSIVNKVYDFAFEDA